MAKRSQYLFWTINLIFALVAIGHVWSVATGHGELAVLSKMMLSLSMAALLRQQLKDAIPITIWTAVLFCLCGDVLLQPLDTDYANMEHGRDVNFFAGIVCFILAYGNLVRYLLQLVPDWRHRVRAQPLPLMLNVAVTIGLLTWMTCYNRAESRLVPVLWLYSPVVVSCATLSVYVRGAVQIVHWVMLAAGCHIILLSDTLIGLTAFPQVVMPWWSNPVWILSSYALGIVLVFNAVVAIQKSRFAVPTAGLRSV